MVFLFVLDLRHRLSESTIDGARLMAQAISLDVKFDVRVSTFGTSSGILIHAEKMGNKSLNRKNWNSGNFNPLPQQETSETGIVLISLNTPNWHI